MPDGLVEAAPAKINLALHVTGRRANGYHELHGISVFTELSDEVTVRPAPADRLDVRGPFAAGLATGANNLVWRAVAAFRTRWPGRVDGGLEITLNKMLPVASGIGGGSADAAATLRALGQLSSEPVAAGTLADVAAGLGADVPMCVFSRACRISGVGEIIEPLTAAPGGHLVLVNPLRPLSTAEVFRHLGRHDNPPLPPLPEGIERLAVFSLWLADTRNDLEAAAEELVPEIAAIRAAIAETRGCVLARMSGSGATVFGLYGSSAQAMQAARDLRQVFPDHWVAATPLLADGLA